MTVEKEQERSLLSGYGTVFILMFSSHCCKNAQFNFSLFYQNNGLSTTVCFVVVDFFSSYSVVFSDYLRVDSWRTELWGELLNW